MYVRLYVCRYARMVFVVIRIRYGRIVSVCGVCVCVSANTCK